MEMLPKQKSLYNLIKVICLSSLFFTAVARAVEPDNHFEGWRTVGPSGGDVRTIVVDPKDKNRLFISTLDGQVYKSTDAAKSWELSANFDRPQLVLDQLLIDTRDSNIIYTSGHRQNTGGFFKSTDGGATWKEAKELRNEAIHAMVQSTKNPNMMLVGTLTGVWISQNSGDDWKKIESPTMPINIDSLAIDPNDLETIYAGTFWRPYKTTDGGKNWKLISKGMIDDYAVFAIEIDSKNPNHIIASACSGIYETQDKGELWKKVQGIPSQSRRTRDILQNPALPNAIYAATTEGFWMTSDGGKTWALTTQRELEVNSIAVNPDEPNKVYIGTNNYGVMVSNDGGKNFVQSNGNFSSRLTYSITPDIERSNRLYATTINTATGGGFIFVSDDGGQTWLPSSKNMAINRVIPYTILQDKTNPNTIYLATNLGMYQSLDRGNSWSPMLPPPPPKTKRRVAPRSARGKRRTVVKKTAEQIAAEQAAQQAAEQAAQNHVAALTDKINFLSRTEDGKNGMFAGTAKGLYRTYDTSKGWDRINFGDGFDTQVFTVAVSAQNPQTIWVGTSTGGVIVSKDDGATWEKVSGVPDAIPVVAIAIDPLRPENIYVGTIQTLYLSRDGGKTWARRGGNLPLGNYNSILINPRNPDEVFVGSALESNGGIYQSTDTGKNWKRIDGKNANLPSRRVWTMTFDPANPNRIFAGTHSSGIFRVDRTPLAATNTNSGSSETITRPRVSTTGN
ncbi:MAG: WD40/YVTN/BNR-like repeat-containing protein [Pyrinomonadaceae bacterium]